MEMMTEKNPVKDQVALKREYKDAIEYLDKHYAYFLTHVLHIGRPIWTEAIGTAAVAMQESEANNSRGDDYDFNFMFSPKFASALSTKGMAFILAHETLHIVLNHLRLVNDFVDRARLKELDTKRKGGTKLTKNEWKELLKGAQAAGKFNIAADCVINDYLVNAGLTDDEFYTPEGQPQLCRGYDKIGEDAAFLTVHDVYERLEEIAQQQKDQDGEDEEGDGMPGMPGQGQPGQGQPGDMDGRGGQALDSHDWLLDPDFADEMADAIDKMNDEIEAAGKMPQDIQDKKDEEDGGQTAAQQQLQNSMRAGSEDGNMQAFMGGTGAKLGWVKLLKELDPDMFKEPAIAPPPVAQWHKRPRKLGGMNKRTILPVREKSRREKEAREKPAIVLALDVSGSIGPKDAHRFIELAKSIPQERIKLFTCTFEYNYNKVDIVNDEQFKIGGGTNFDAVPKFIEDHVKPELKGKYPKAVVIITDGEAGLTLKPTEDEAKGWFWLISPHDRAGSTYPASKQIGRRAMLSEFVA